MRELTDFRIALCQMSVIPGRPDLNTKYIIDQIYDAHKNNIDTIIFPEMCLTGYMIGDLYEDDCFVKDVQLYNEQIREATKIGISAVFGTLVAEYGKKGENGRLRKFNTALTAQNGEWLGSTIKSLHPNYRIFDDNRHFYSMRKIREEQNEKTESNLHLRDYLHPIPIQTKVGEIKVGIILCEDMWHEDYLYNPTESLVENGADIIFNLSASPWTWQKNRKRHQVIKNLLEKCCVPLVYVNNTGIQNTGKNIVVFDGSSGVYNADGDLIFEIPPYESGSQIFTFNKDSQPIKKNGQDDSAELYDALKHSVEMFLKTFPPHMRKVVIGLSGGIDSGLSIALFTSILGPENIFAINMPSKYNQPITKKMAKETADNLGVEYEVIPIQEIVDKIANTLDVKEDSVAYENIQSRIRMEIIAAKTQKIGGVFTANCNKVELAFGYGTLYGDMAGFLTVLGDLVKREVYQLADYINRIIYKREVIPKKCFEMLPSAELKDNQRDPFDYGNLNRRGYHDEMVRAFTEFRRNPEWFLEKYAKKQLEDELLLEPNTLTRLFPTSRDFVKDLEKNWNRFYGSYFKRVQSAPIPMVSKRAFGTDLRESIISSHLTQRYHDLKKLVLSRNEAGQRIAIFGGSFNPPGKHHVKIAEILSKNFDLVIVTPCGMRSDKPSANIIDPKHRGEMVKIAFKNLPKVQLDLFDLESDIYTPTYILQKHYEEKFKNAQIWHVVGGDIIHGGHNSNSEIHRIWHNGNDIWQNLNFAVINCQDFVVQKEDMPPSSELIEIDNLYGRGTLVRKRLNANEPIDDLVSAEVESYIYKHKIYLESE